MSNKQFRVLSTIARIPVVGGSFSLTDIPRQNDGESLYFRLTGQVQVTVAGTAVRADAPTQLIQRVDIIADGRNQICSAPFWDLALCGVDRDNFNATGARNLTPPSAASVATYSIEAQGVFDFCLPDGERAKDSNFPTQALSLYQMRLTFGNGADLFTGTPTVNLINCFVEVSYAEMVEIPDAEGKRTMPFFLKKKSFQEYAVTSTNSNFEVRLPAGNLIKSISLRADGLTTAGEPSTGIINNVIARAAQDVRLNITGQSLRAVNNRNYGRVPDGYYHHDFSRAANNAARMTELWNVTNQTEPKLVFDAVGGANVKIGVVTTEMIAR